MKKVLQISDYANDINLYDDFLFRASNTEDKEQIVDSLLVKLNEQNNLFRSYSDKRNLLRAKINTLYPNTFSQDSINKLNQLLQLELLEKAITDSGELSIDSVKTIGKTKVVVWRGDICTLKVDAIVNAANSQMLGCFQPLHACIDNAIHSAAGVQLRDDCHVIMQKQGFAEPTGAAKITRAYNLPSKYVLHTVGPVIQGEVSQQNRTELAKAYTSCLEVCSEMVAIRSIAFCGISTGVFAYPAHKAAVVAFSTVNNWIKNNPGCLDLVVFNVFSDSDKKIYDALIDEL